MIIANNCSCLSAACSGEWADTGTWVTGTWVTQATPELAGYGMKMQDLKKQKESRSYISIIKNNNSKQYFYYYIQNLNKSDI